MWTGFEITSEPEAEPVTAAEVKTELRLTTSDHDTMIGNKITACRQFVEGYLHKALITQTIIAYWSDFENRLYFPYGNVQSVTSVKYLDKNGTEQTLAGTVYRSDLKSLAPWIGLEYNQSWPTARGVSNSVYVEYIAGYGDAGTDVPMSIKLGIIALCIDMYEHPEYSPEIALQNNNTAKNLLNRYRRTSFI